MKKGFTLIELLAVVLMIAIFSSIALPQYRKSIARSYVTEAKEALPAIFNATQRWLVENQEKGTANLKFKQLDVSLKGSISSASASTWETPNFKYTFPQYNDSGTLTANATAEMRNGRYQGLKVYYDGSVFSCCPPTGSGKSDYCDDLDLKKGSC